MNAGRPPVDAPDDPPPRVTRKIAKEAATWVARLHGPDRDRHMELACLEWQSRSAANRHAFERCTEIWMEVPNVARAAGYVPTPRPPVGADPVDRRRLLVAACGALAVAVPIAVWSLWPDGTGYRTAIGEAQTVMLQDGSRMFLNTNTRVRVELDAKQRTVRIESGEALFEVAKDSQRPFVVRAGSSEVVAIGTAFSVRLTGANGTHEALAITLLEGQVSVRPVGGSGKDAVAASRALTMQPGERVRMAKAPGRDDGVSLRFDRPPLDHVTAWKRNEAVFDRTSLVDAVAEMNRYSRTPLVLMGDLPQAEWLVSGQFRTGDNAAFASVLATVHGLVVREREGRLELSKAL